MIVIIIIVIMIIVTLIAVGSALIEIVLLRMFCKGEEQYEQERQDKYLRDLNGIAQVSKLCGDDILLSESDFTQDCESLSRFKNKHQFNKYRKMSNRCNRVYWKENYEEKLRLGFNIDLGMWLLLERGEDKYYCIPDTPENRLLILTAYNYYLKHPNWY